MHCIYNVYKEVVRIVLSQYMEKMGTYSNLLKHSAIWRLDHILDTSVPDDVKEQWIYEIKEIIEEIVRR